MSYSWGDDSDKSVRSSDEGGYDYRSARAAYKEEPTPRASSTRSSTASSRKSAYKSRIGKTAAPVGKELQSKSTHPIVVATDVTGSMSEWPGIIFEKLPLLGKEVARYAPKHEISFAAFGDAYCDGYPLQVRDFASGETLDEHISALYPEGQGGDDPESHDLVAYYYLNHCKIDEAVKPIFILITDVRSHTTLKASVIKKYVGDDAQSSLDSIAILKKLAEKFSVYVFLRGMGDRKFWEDIYGVQRVKPIEEPRDVVELIIGTIAGELGELKDFEMRSSKRHADKPDRVERVMKSVKSGATEPTAGSDGKAKTTEKSGESMKSKKLV